MKAKGRFPRGGGALRGNAKLTMEQAEEIRASRESVKELVLRFGIHNTQIYRIRRGVAYVAPNGGRAAPGAA